MSSCNYCGSSSFGTGCLFSPNETHEHTTAGDQCNYCGSSSYGSGCAFAPGNIHRHGLGNGCIYCGSSYSGSGCIYNPHGNNHVGSSSKGFYESGKESEGNQNNNHLSDREYDDYNEVEDDTGYDLKESFKENNNFHKNEDEPLKIKQVIAISTVSLIVFIWYKLNMYIKSSFMLTFMQANNYILASSSALILLFGLLLVIYITNIKKQTGIWILLPSADWSIAAISYLFKGVILISVLMGGCSLLYYCFIKFIVYASNYINHN